MCASSQLLLPSLLVQLLPILQCLACADVLLYSQILLHFMPFFCLLLQLLRLHSRFVRSHFDFNLYVLLLIFSFLVFMCLWCFCFLSYRHILFIIRSAFEIEKWSHKIFRVYAYVCPYVHGSHLFRFFFSLLVYV